MNGDCEFWRRGCFPSWGPQQLRRNSGVWRWLRFSQGNVRAEVAYFGFMAGGANYRQSYAAVRTGSGVDLVRCLRSRQSWFSKTTPDAFGNKKAHRSGSRMAGQAHVGSRKYSPLGGRSMDTFGVLARSYTCVHVVSMGAENIFRFRKSLAAKEKRPEADCANAPFCARRRRDL
jgi:hypothetical protein